MLTFIEEPDVLLMFTESELVNPTLNVGVLPTVKNNVTLRVKGVCVPDAWKDT